MQSSAYRRAAPPLRNRASGLRAGSHRPSDQGFARPADTADQLKRNLLGQITCLEKDLTLLRGRLLALESASETLSAAPAPRRRSQTPRPALAPLILSLLPAEGGLMALDEVISGMLAREQVDVDDRVARSKAYRRANLCLSKLRADGLVVSHRVGSGRLDWGRNPDAPALDA